MPFAKSHQQYPLHRMPIAKPYPVFKLLINVANANILDLTYILGH
jgi:hypothetical protein